MTAFTADYYLRGKSLGLSCYEDYTWRPDMTLPAAHAIVAKLGLDRDMDRVLDFGCARGYLVRAFRALGIQAWGEDVSTWAVGAGADPVVRGYLASAWRGVSFSWIVAKDVLEHIPTVDETLADLALRVTRGVFFVVPVTEIDGGAYIEPDEEKDPTHVIRWTRATWLAHCHAVWPGWRWSSWARVKGIKDHRDGSMGYAFLRGLNQ